MAPKPQPPSAAPTPTESDDSNTASSPQTSTTTSQPQPTRPIPPSSISPSQGPKGSSTQQKTVKPDGADKPDGEGKGGTLKEAAMKNVTMLGDPVSLKAETSEHSPKPEEDGARERLKSKI